MVRSFTARYAKYKRLEPYEQIHATFSKSSYGSRRPSKTDSSPQTVFKVFCAEKILLQFSEALIMKQKVILISLYTVQQLITQHLIPFFIALLFLPLLIGHVLGSYTLGSYEKFLLDFSFLGLQLFILFFITFFVIPFREKQTAHHIPQFFLAQSLKRTHWILGTYLGFITIIISAGIIFYGTNMLILYCAMKHWFVYLLPAYAAFMAEGILLTAIGICCSYLLPTTFAYITTAALYLIGHLNHTWLAVIKKHTTGIQKILGYIAYYLFPDLSALDIKSTVIHELPYSGSALTCAIIYAIGFAALFVYITSLIFEKKWLK